MKKPKKITVTITTDPKVWYKGQDYLSELKRKGNKKFRGMSNYVEHLLRKDLKITKESET